MTSEEQDIRRFETRVRQMILAFKEQKQRNDALAGKLEEKDREIKNLKSQINGLKTEYDSLKMARMIDISTNDMEGAKERLAKLIKEVNKCIDLVKEKN